MLSRTLPFLAVALASFAALAGACGDELAAPPATADSGSTSGAVGEGICPGGAPDAGDICVLPEGTTCAFGACGTPIAQCVGGLWRYGGNPAPQPLCPDKDPPASESACPPCWPQGVTCQYGSLDCSKPDASANRTQASCRDGIWTLSYVPCAPTDGGADVQGDADAGPG